MATRNSLDVAKREILSSINQLPPDAQFAVIFGLVQIRRFSGNSTDDERALTVQGSQRGAPTAVSGAAEAGVAEHFQPMRVGLPSE